MTLLHKTHWKKSKFGHVSIQKMDLPALLEAAGVYDERLPVYSDALECLTTLVQTIPPPLVACLRHRHAFSPLDASYHVLSLLSQGDLMTRFEAINAHIVFVVNGVEVADVTKKTVLPLRGLPRYIGELHLYPLNRTKAVCISFLEVFYSNSVRHDSAEIASAHSLLCGSFIVQDGVIDDGLIDSVAPLDYEDL